MDGSGYEIGTAAKFALLAKMLAKTNGENLHPPVTCSVTVRFQIRPVPCKTVLYRLNFNSEPNVFFWHRVPQYAKYMLAQRNGSHAPQKRKPFRNNKDVGTRCDTAGRHRA